MVWFIKYKNILSNPNFKYFSFVLSVLLTLDKDTDYWPPKKMDLEMKLLNHTVLLLKI